MLSHPYPEYLIQVVAQCGPPGPPGAGPPGGHMCLGLPCPRPPPECVFLEPTIVYVSKLAELFSCKNH